MKKLALLFFFVLVSFQSFSQTDKEITDYFNQFLTVKSQFHLLNNSFPSLKDCEAVFIGDNAKIYFEGIKKVKDEIEQILPKLEDKKAIGSYFTKFTSDRAKNDKYTHGMNKIKDVLKPGITYYLINYQERGGVKSKYSPYKFFVYVNGKWVFFPKPTIVFRKK